MKQTAGKSQLGEETAEERETARPMEDVQLRLRQDGNELNCTAVL